jgi:hypothetical protein
LLPHWTGPIDNIYTEFSQKKDEEHGLLFLHKRSSIIDKSFVVTLNVRYLQSIEKRQHWNTATATKIKLKLKLKLKEENITKQQILNNTNTPTRDPHLQWHETVGRATGGTIGKRKKTSAHLIACFAGFAS